MIVGCKCGKSKVVSRKPDPEYGQDYYVVECEECGYYWEGYMGICDTSEDTICHEEKELIILVFQPGEHPAVRQIRNDLKTMQCIVGGYIEIVKLGDNLILVCDEEGMLKGYPPNRRVGRDVIRGTFFICRSEGPEFASVTDEDVKRYMEC